MSFDRLSILDFARGVAPRARLDLFSTAVPAPRWADLGVDPQELADLGSGHEPAARLSALVCARHGVTADELVFTPGATEGSFCALTALVDGVPDAEVVIETPTYTPLAALVDSVGARAVSLPRRAEAGFMPDPDELARALTPRTRAVVRTDLHNPSGTRIDAERMSALIDIVEDGPAPHAYLFVDEVYLEFVPEPTPATAYRPGRRVVVCRSVTKAFGLGWLRCGWIIAPPAIAQRAREVRDYVSVFLPSPTALACAAALATDADRRTAAAARVRAGFAIVRERLAACEGVELVEPYADAPAISFPRLAVDSADDIVTRALADGACVGPGRLFGAPAHARIASAADPATLREGLDILVAAVTGSPA